MVRLLNNFIYLFIYSCLIISCKGKKVSSNISNEKNKPIYSVDSVLVKDTKKDDKNKFQLQKKEVFYVDSVLINGKVPLCTTYDFFIKNFGKQDSIKPFTGEMYSSFEDTVGVETKSLYKNNSEYELYNGKLI